MNYYYFHWNILGFQEYLSKEFDKYDSSDVVLMTNGANKKNELSQAISDANKNNEQQFLVLTNSAGQRYIFYPRIAQSDRVNLGLTDLCKMI